jgi:hypothetical protein
MKKDIMSLSPRCAARSGRSRALIILFGQHVVVELGMPRPRLRYDSGSAGVEGQGKRKNPSLWSSKAPSRSIHTLVRDISYSSRPNFPPSICAPLLSGQGGEHHSHNRLSLVAPPVASAMSRSTVGCFRHRLIRKIQYVPSPCGLRSPGGAVGGMLSR